MIKLLNLISEWNIKSLPTGWTPVQAWSGFLTSTVIEQYGFQLSPDDDPEEDKSYDAFIFIMKPKGGDDTEFYVQISDDRDDKIRKEKFSTFQEAQAYAYYKMRVISALAADNQLNEWKIAPSLGGLPTSWRKLSLDFDTPMISAFFKRMHSDTKKPEIAILIQNEYDQNEEHILGYYLRIYPEDVRYKYYNDESFYTYEEAENFAKQIMSKINEDIPLY